MKMDNLIVLGRAEEVSFPGIGLSSIPARIDTGARTSTLWASKTEVKDGVLSVVFLGPTQKNYDKDAVHTFENFSRLKVMSSNGQIQNRFLVNLVIKIGGKRIRAKFTLADRSTQVYPVLVGRNVLKGKFVVNVKVGKALVNKEKELLKKIQSSKPNSK